MDGSDVEVAREQVPLCVLGDAVRYEAGSLEVAEVAEISLDERSWSGRSIFGAPAEASLRPHVVSYGRSTRRQRRPTMPINSRELTGWKSAHST